MKKQYYDSPIKAQDMFIEDFQELWNILEYEITNRTGDYYNDGVIGEVTFSIIGNDTIQFNESFFYLNKNRVIIEQDTTYLVDTSSDGVYYLYTDYTENIEEREELRERRVLDKKHKYIDYSPNFYISLSTDPSKILLGTLTISGNILTGFDISNQQVITSPLIDDSVQNLTKTWSSQKIMTTIVQQIANAAEPIISILNTPPISPSDNDRYIVGTSPTGVWVGHDNDIAEWSDEISDWVYTTPTQGKFVSNQTTGEVLVWDTSAWVRFETWLSFDYIPDGTTYRKMEVTYASPPSSDLNAIVKSGWYIGSSASNKPTGATGYVFAITNGGSGGSIQVFFSSLSKQIWYRFFNGAVWSSWYDIFNLDNIEDGTTYQRIESSYRAVPSSNLDNIIKTGIYDGTGATNRPTGFSSGYVFSNGGAGYHSQIWSDLTSTKVLYRSKDTSYRRWHRIEPHLKFELQKNGASAWSAVSSYDYDLISAVTWNAGGYLIIDFTASINITQYRMINGITWIDDGTGTIEQNAIMAGGGNIREVINTIRWYIQTAQTVYVYFYNIIGSNLDISTPTINNSRFNFCLVPV